MSLDNTELLTNENVFKVIINKQKIIKVIQFFFILVSVTVFVIFVLSKISLNPLDPAYITINFLFNEDKELNLNKTNQTLSACSPIVKEYKPYLVSFNGSIYPKSIPLFMNESINFECLQKTDKIKKILLWTTFFGDPNFIGIGVESPFVKQKCPVTKCEMTNDKNQVSNADLVIVHMRDSINEIPPIRPDNQRWIFTLYESPVHSPYFKNFKNKFNYTSTYRIDSEFPSFYESDSQMYWRKNEKFNPSNDFYSEKSAFAAAIISNCGGSSKRLEYIKELQKYVSVSLFGRCGKQCPKSFKNSTPGDCKEIIGQEYKFYLAFENSVCKDYITEKFFVILQFNIIPVVLGGGLYEHYIPKSAFINVKDFESPKKLAEYMLYLDQNKTAYNSYFKWKEHVIFGNNPVGFSPLCNMCIQLHLERYYGVKRQIIDNIDEYWHKDTCKSPQIDSNNVFKF